MPTWRDLIAASGLPTGEARLLAAHASARPRSWMLAHDDEEAGTTADALRALYARRRSGEPIAYITGQREFYSLEFTITPDVLIPRPETELLVDLALERLPQGGRMLDIGTGSGAIAVSVAHARADAAVSACDLSEAALNVARGNATRHGVAVRFEHSDLLAAYSGQRFHVIASNPPYIAAGDAHLSQGDVRFEPRLALTSGSDGLELIRRIAGDARAHLHAGGWLLLEHGHDQGATCTALLRSLGYTEVNAHADLAGIARVCVGRA